MRRLPALLLSLLLAGGAAAQDAQETLEESFARCTAARDKMIVLLGSCTAAIDSGRLLPRGLAHALLVRGFALKTLKRYDAALADYDRAIALEPAFLPALRARADLFAARRDYARAIAELDRVIHADPSDHAAWKRRGDYKDWSGDHDGAIADYDEAMARGGPEKLLAERAAALANKGETARAVADLDKAIAAAPEHAPAWFERGRLRFVAGEFAAAASDLARAAELEPEDGFRALWAYMASARAGDPKAREALATRADALDLADWPGPLIEVYLGRRDPVTLTDDELPAGWERTGRRVEIEFYLAMLDLLAGDQGKAAARLRAARDLGVPEYIEHRTALAELTRLGK